MKRIFAWLALTALTAAIAHAAIVLAAPYVIMSRAMERLSGPAGENVWRLGPRVTPQEQAVIRSSPDLAYASCAYDLSKGPVRIRIGPATGLTLLTLYGDNTDAFLTLTEAEIGPSGAELILVRQGAAPPASAARTVVSPSVRGLAIERRIAPTPAAFSAADAARRQNVCAPL